jgi:hypothetical protein
MMAADKVTISQGRCCGSTERKDKEPSGEQRDEMVRLAQRVIRARTANGA